MSRLTSWAASLVDPLDQFHSATSPLDTNFQNAVHDFTNITKALMGPRSGPEAFSGQASSAFQQAIDICLSRDQALIDANVLGEATTACNNFAQQIEEATNRASGFATDEPTLEEVIGAMSISQAAQYGSAAIPQWIISATRTQMQQAHHVPDAELAALGAQNTLQALEGMADTIHSDVPQWEKALDGDVSEHASFWGDVKQWVGDAETIFEVMSKLFHNEKIKNLSELLDKGKGSYLASLGFLLTVLADPPKNPDMFMRELYGSGVAWGASLIPGVGEVTLALEAAHLAGPWIASGQDAFAKEFGKGDPSLITALQEPAAGIKEGAEKIEPGSIFNDLGAFLYDGSSMYSNMHGQDQARQAELKDLGNLGSDTWKVADGSWQFSTNLVGGGLDDIVTLSLGHNDPAVAVPVVHAINTGTHWVASAPEKAVHWIGSLF